MTYGQLGLVDGLGFGFALLLEIPTGVLGDLIGKKKVILLSLIASSIGVGMIAFSGTFTVLFIGWMITQFGLALFSGTGDAFLYDNLVEAGREEDYSRIVARSRNIATWTFAITAFLGSYLYFYWFRLPHVLWGVGYILALGIVPFLVEPKVSTIRFSLKNYMRQLSIGFRLLFHSRLINYALFALFISGAYYMYSWGFIRPAMANSFGFYVKEQGWIFPSLAILSTFLVRLLPQIRNKISDLAGLSLLLCLISLGFMTAFLPLGKYGLIVLFVIAMAGNLADPWISVVVNKEIESKYRATTLSTLALLSKIPYVLLAIIAGKAIDKGSFGRFNLAYGAFLLLMVVVGIAIDNIIKNSSGKVRIPD
jgi:MFS family permease